MKKWLPILLCCTLLWGCSSNSVEGGTESTQAISDATQENEAHPQVSDYSYAEIPCVSQFDTETAIALSDGEITVTGNEEAVFLSNDIVYYEDRDTYPSGNPYGAGSDADKHTAEEAAAHTVVNITQPGAYRVTGTLSAGQIRIDLGEDAYDDEAAVVELILDNVSITCTVAPAILFKNVYECDGDWSEETAQAIVDTSAAGAKLILEGENTVRGSYVAKIYKDNKNQKKLYKQDGGIYSYMSMNVYGPGRLDLTAENEGLDSELHLTINGGHINIRSQDDGINTNEDGVSVTTINAGRVHIIAGLGAEGDGIDSNGFLVINGGVVVAAANPASDSGLDSDMGSYINGGIVVALGSTMDWAESDSDQVTMNLQFAQLQRSDASIVVTCPDGTVAFAYDPGEDEILGENIRQYQGAVISCPNFLVGQSYQLYLGGDITGSEAGGVYDVTTITDFSGGTRMGYTGTDVGMGPGGMGGGFGGMPGGMEKPEDFDPDSMELPEGMEIPQDFDPNAMGQPGQMEPPGDGTPPEGFDPDDMDGREMPEGMEKPGDFAPGSAAGTRPEGTPATEDMADRDTTLFYMTDKVNAFSGITAVS